MSIIYEWVPGHLLSKDHALLSDCASLYSKHYGNWAQDAPKNPGQPIRLSASRIHDLVKSPDAMLAYARDNGNLVGYAIVIRSKVEGYGVVSWVTQLVVHEQYRRQGVAKILLFSLWGFTDHFAWGLVSANPYAIRALEKATRRRCVPQRIARNHRKLLTVADGNVKYVPRDIEAEIHSASARINTKFFVDHSHLDEMIAEASTGDKPWLLGNLDPGWEWFAFTFIDQDQIRLTSDELKVMLETSDHVVRQAYSRMTLDSTHAWTKHAPAEANHVINWCGLKPGDSVLDFGCGNGRHAIELAERGLVVTGVDYLAPLIERVRSSAQSSKCIHIEFFEADCRSINLQKQFHAVICLYDVVGSFADQAENQKILSNIANHLTPGSLAVISVMNMVFADRRAKHRFSLQADPNQLLWLTPSRTMETTGNIFDPDYYMIDEETGIVYRKEQFECGTSLPAELIVRDRRFKPDEIVAMCRAAGLEVIWQRCVRAGDWDTPLAPEHDRAKEILVLCRKPN